MPVDSNPKSFYAIAEEEAERRGMDVKQYLAMVEERARLVRRLSSDQPANGGESRPQSREGLRR